MSISYPYPLPPSYYPPVPAAAAVAVAPEPVFSPVPDIPAPKPKVSSEVNKVVPLNSQGKPVSRQALWKQKQKEKLKNEKQ